MEVPPGGGNKLKQIITATSLLAASILNSQALAETNVSNSSLREDAFNRLIYDASGNPFVNSEFGQNSKDNLFVTSGDFTLIEGSNIDSSQAVIAQNIVFRVNGDLSFQASGSNTPDLYLRGRDGLTNNSENDGLKNGLAVLSVKGAINSNIDYFWAHGNALVSTNEFNLTRGAVQAMGESVFSSAQWGDTDATPGLLVFQNQETNAKNNQYSIEKLVNKKTDEGIYINTTGLQFTANSGTRIVSYEDVQINLGDKDFTLDGATIDASNGAFYLTSSGTNSLQVSGNAVIKTPEFHADDGAIINVASDSSAVFGTTTASNATLTLGGDGFSLGSEEEYFKGFIDTTGSVAIKGGEYFLSSEEIKTDVGLRSSSTMNISDGAVITAEHGTHIFAGVGQEKTDATLNISGQGTSVKIGGRDLTGYRGNLYDAVFNKFGSNSNKDSFGGWSVLGSSYDVLIKNNASITLGAASVLFAQYHQIHAYSGTEVHTDSSLFANENHTDPATIHANMSISIDGIGSTYNGLLWVESGLGNIQMLGGHFDIEAAASRTGLISQKGSIKLVSIDSGTDELDGSMIIKKDLNTKNGTIYALKDITIHGDKNLSISDTELQTGNTSALSNIQLTSAGEINLTNAIIDTRTQETSWTNLGNIKIFGATAQNYQKGAASTSFSPTDVGEAITITNSHLYGNLIQIGNLTGGAKTISITNSELYTNGDGFGTGYAFDLRSQGDLTITGSEITYSDGNNGYTNISSVNGNITLDNTTVNDNAWNESGRGTLSVFIENGSGKTIEIKNNSLLDDDTIKLGAGLETINILNSIIHVDTDGNGLMLKAQELSLSESHIGENKDGNTSPDGTAITGSVSISAPTITLSKDSFITSKGSVDIQSNSISMAPTAEGELNWIKGQTVNISNDNLEGIDGNLAITGGQITTIGTEVGNDINISSSTGLEIEGVKEIDAGKGNVNISTGLGSNSTIQGTPISGNTISFAGNANEDNKDKGFGTITINESAVTAGDDGDTETGGKINIGTGVNVVVSSDASLTANQGTNDESTGIDVNGGKLTIEVGGLVTSGNDVDVTGGGSIDFTGIPSTDVDAGKLVVGGNLTVGGTASDAEQVGGSINVANGSDAIIIAKGENNQGNNVTVGSGGKINIANGSHLFVTNDEASQPSTSDSDSGLTVNGDGTTVNIAGGTLIADQINTGSGSSVDNKTLVGSDSYISLENPFKDDSSSDLSFVIDGEANDIVLDITGNLEDGKLSSVLEAMKGHGTVMVSGKDNGLLSPEEWADKLGASVDDKLVISDAGIDLTEGDTTSKREQNSITQGGGGWLVGDSSQGSGSIQVTGGESSDVYVTGAQTEADRNGFEAIRDKDNKTPMGVHVTENSNLTFGNAGSYGGDVSAGITTEAGSNTNFIGGTWNAESITGEGNLNIIDKSKFETGVTVTVNEALHANDWNMSGDHTALNANNGASFDGKGHLSGGANAVITGGSLSVGQGLTLEDNAVLTSTEGSEINGGLTVENGTTFNEEKDLVVSGGNSNFHGTINVDGNYTNTDENFSTIVTGTTNIGGSANTNDLIVGSDSFNGSGLNGSFTAGSANVGGNFVANTQSSTTINGDFTVKGDSLIASGAQVTVNGGQANFNGGLHVSENGAFENKSPNAGTTVDNYLILEAGSNVIAGNEFKLSDKDVSIGTDPSGTLNGHISASDLIDFSNANVNVTFTGENAGTDAHHIQAGANGITYTGGASHLFTKDDDDPEGGIVTGVVTVGTNGSLTMDADNFGQSDKANLIMNDSLKLSDENSMVIVGTVSKDLIDGPGIYLGSDSYFDLNASQFGNGDSIVTTGDDTGTIYLTDETTININNWTLGTDGSLKVNFDVLGDSEKDITDFLNSDNALYNFWYEDGYLGMGLESSSSFGANNKFTDVVDAVLASDSENAMKQSLVTGVFSKSSGFMTQQADGSWIVNELGNQRLQDVLGLPIAAGAFNIAYDAMSEMNQTMANRMAEPITAHSVSVWADVIATYNSADELFGNSGYSADIYAAVMGADVGITEDWIAGVAFTIGQGDADGEGDTMGIQNDADFYGFSVYTAKNVGQLRFSGDMGYLKLKNDISTDVNYGGKGDTDVITVGARMDMTVHQGEQFDVTPHFGIRYANFNIDTINGTATNDINVVEVPLGVTVKGKTSMNGWKVAPMVDVSVVPQFGDKKAKIWNSGVAYEQDVLDSALVKTSVGVSAQKGNFTFGLNYRLGAGNDERQNHSFNANIRYQF